MIRKILFVVSARPVSSELCDILSPESGAGNPTDRAESRGNCHLQREVCDMMKLPNISGDYYYLLWPLQCLVDCGWPQPPESGSCLMVLQIIKTLCLPPSPILAPIWISFACYTILINFSFNFWTFPCLFFQKSTLLNTPQSTNVDKFLELNTWIWIFT